MIVATWDKSTTVNVHPDKKIKRERKGGGCHICIVTEPEDEIYRISFLTRRRLVDNKSAPFRYKGMGSFGRGVLL